MNELFSRYGFLILLAEIAFFGGIYLMKQGDKEQELKKLRPATDQDFEKYIAQPNNEGPIDEDLEMLEKRIEDQLKLIRKTRRKRYEHRRNQSN